MLPELVTARLLLRRWIPADREPFSRMNADPRVMEHYPTTLSRAESDAIADRIEQHFSDKGFGLWAVELPGAAPFAGYVGLSVPRFVAPFTPCVEIGWRIAPSSGDGAWPPRPRGRCWPTASARSLSRRSSPSPSPAIWLHAG